MGAGPAVLKFARGLPPSRQFGERLRLLVLQGPEQGACFSLLGETIFVGREDCQIMFADTNISRKHAEISWQGDHYMVRDLGSANGVLHNGLKITKAKLGAGDLVMMGLTVLEVYPAGQVKRNERPQLPANAKRPALALAGQVPVAEAAPAEGRHSEASEAEVKAKRQTDKKRLIIYVGIFFLVFTLYFGTEEKLTVRENARIESSQQAAAPKGKRKTAKQIEAELAEVMPSYALDTQQRKDAEIFFRSGVREQQNKNFRRAFTAFETALTVDPTHELAKIYLRSAKMEMMAELKAMNNAAVQAHRALRYKEARMHFGNIVRYLEAEDGGAALEKYVDRDLLANRGKGKGSSESIPEMYEKAKAALKELDKVENKAQ